MRKVFVLIAGTQNSPNFIREGFTLIELLIVISIIGVLAGLLTVSFTSAQRQARDTQRKSDMTQYRSALESFASANNGLYPYSNGAVNMSDLCSSNLSSFASDCPEDPSESNGWPTYIYWTYDGSGNQGDPTATKYFMYNNGALEAKSDMFWVVCSNGKSGELATSGGWDSIVAYCQ